MIMSFKINYIRQTKVQSTNSKWTQQLFIIHFFGKSAIYVHQYTMSQ